MAEKKKMSVAEILAAARKADSKSTAQPPAEPAAAEESVAPASEAEAAAPTPAAKPAAKPPAAKGKEGGRPSVADMLAMARAQKAGGGEAAAKPAAAKAAAAEKPAAEKPAPKAAPKPKPAEKAAPNEPAVAAASGTKTTASILAAARTEAKPGPISKSEAARLKPDAPVKEKPRAYVPPMPVKPDYAKPKGKAAAEPEERRFYLKVVFGSFLAVGFMSMSTTFGLWTLAMARFMFPNTLAEPPSRFKVGFPSDFPPGGVEEKFKALFGVWIVNTEYAGKREIVALRTVCTHLGCTPNWLEGEQKFKCPCHGSGFYKDGINFEGPAPRPLERYAIQLADDGQLEVDKSKLFQEELGQWNDPASYVSV